MKPAQIRWNAARRLAKAEDRWFDRNARLKERPKFPDLECAWAAGHFEGEGTITLTRGGRIRHVRPQVSMSSTDASVIRFFNDRWPGVYRCFLPKSATGNVREAHTWSLGSGERIEGFLRDVFDHFRTDRVKQKAIVVLDEIRDRGLYQQQPEIRNRSEQRLALIRSLNAKGRETIWVYGDIRAMLPIRPALPERTPF